MISQTIRVENSHITFDVHGFIQFETDWADLRIPFKIFDKIAPIILAKKTGM